MIREVQGYTARNWVGPGLGIKVCLNLGPVSLCRFRALLWLPCVGLENLVIGLGKHTPGMSIDLRSLRSLRLAGFSPWRPHTTGKLRKRLLCPLLGCMGL